MGGLGVRSNVARQSAWSFRSRKACSFLKPEKRGRDCGRSEAEKCGTVGCLSDSAWMPLCGRLGAFLGPLEGLSGVSRGLLGASWGFWGASGGLLGACWRSRMPSWGKHPPPLDLSLKGFAPTQRHHSYLALSVTCAGTRTERALQELARRGSHHRPYLGAFALRFLFTSPFALGSLGFRSRSTSLFTLGSLGVKSCLTSLFALGSRGVQSFCSLLGALAFKDFHGIVRPGSLGVKSFLRHRELLGALAFKVCYVTELLGALAPQLCLTLGRMGAGALASKLCPSLGRLGARGLTPPSVLWSLSGKSFSRHRTKPSNT